MFSSRIDDACAESGFAPIRAGSSMRVVAVLWMGVLAGCGDRASPQAPPALDATPGRPIPQPSAVAMARPPPVFSRCVLGGVAYVVGDDRHSIEIRPTPDVRPRAIAVPQAEVLALASVVRDDRRYLLVAEISESGALSLVRRHDVDADAIVDESSRNVLLTYAAEPLYIMSIGARSSALMYLADARRGDVLFASDGDGDGWVDRVSPSRFAVFSDHPDLGLVDLRWVGADHDGRGCLWATAEFGYANGDLKLPFTKFFDDDADGYADGFELVTPGSTQPVLRDVALLAQQRRLVVERMGRDAARVEAVIEAWRLGADDSDLSPLGSVRLFPGVMEGEIETRVPLEAGWRVGIRFGSDKTTERRLSVREPRPAIESIEPANVVTGVETVVMVRGRGLRPDMTVRLVGRDVSKTLTFRLHDAASMDVTIPAQIAPGALAVAAIGVGQSMDDPADPVHAVELHVRAP